MVHVRSGVVDELGDRLAAKHLLADSIAGDNANVIKANKLKFPKGLAADIKKLVKFYKFVRFDKKPNKAFSAIKRAFSLYTSYNDRSSIKWVMEALILGGLSDKMVASLSGIDKDVIACYKNYYFDLSGGNKQTLILKSNTMRSSYTADDISSWGYKRGVIINGVDWFIRVYIECDPTEEDEVLRNKLIINNVNNARSDVSHMIGNIDNYRSDITNFSEMVQTVGATYSHIQKDAAQVAKSSGAGGSGSVEVANCILQGIAQAFSKNEVDPNDTKESAFDNEKPAEEELPL